MYWLFIVTISSPPISSRRRRHRGCSRTTSNFLCETKFPNKLSGCLTPHRATQCIVCDSNGKTPHTMTTRTAECFGGPATNQTRHDNESLLVQKTPCGSQICTSTTSKSISRAKRKKTPEAEKSLFHQGKQGTEAPREEHILSKNQSKQQ